ncbi:MAG TPA: family 20 glycosylhydrolase [Acidimicrobiales bacterium]|nr:family 20 glycosylhydrolase [Acidimicrobiales bacterium]
MSDPLDPVLVPRPRQLRLGRRLVAVGEPRLSTDAGLPSEGYRLRVSEGETTIAASGPAGVSRARATLAQLTRQGQAPEAEVEDWPATAVRGFMLDISRDRVPTMDSLRALVDLLAGLKFNHLELYTEHTYAYPGHQEVWAQASPMTADEVAELEAYCAERHIELTPNQNCLGHMERWLVHPRYRPLAVAPAGWTDGRGRLRHPTTIDPANPGSLALARSLLAELLPRFASRRVHVGLDEPFELPAGRMGEYGDYIGALRRAPEVDGREMLIWGDILGRHPELVDRVPSQVTVCEWGYEATHPLEARLERLNQAGLAHWVAPGTSSWNSILGRVANAVGNCGLHASVGRAAGSQGLLLTDWGDNGHLQPPVVSTPAMVVTAEAAWSGTDPAGLDLAAALDAVVFPDHRPGLGAALLRLGDAYRAVKPQVENNVSILLHFYSPQLRVGDGFTEGLDASQLDDLRATLDAGLAALPPDAGLVGEELANAAAMVRLAADDAEARLAGDGTLGPVPEPVRAGLAERALALADEHRRLWLARSRPGGLVDSVARLEHLASCYRAGVGVGFVPPWRRPGEPGNDRAGQRQRQ